MREMHVSAQEMCSAGRTSWKFWVLPCVAHLRLIGTARGRRVLLRGVDCRRLTGMARRLRVLPRHYRRLTGIARRLRVLPRSVDIDVAGCILAAHEAGTVAVLDVVLALAAHEAGTVQLGRTVAVRDVALALAAHEAGTVQLSMRYAAQVGDAAIKESAER